MKKRLNYKLSTTQTIMLSFFIAILAGSFLLWLPISTADKSIFKHDPSGRAAKAYQELVKEVEGIYDKKRKRSVDIGR